MATLDLTLASLRLAGVENFTPEFGTKEANNVGVSTENLCRDLMLPFSRQRPIEVSENSTTGEVQADTRLVFTNSGITLNLSAASFAGCRVLVMGKFQTGTARVSYSGKYVSLAAGEKIEFMSGGDGKFALVDYSQSHNIPRRTPKDITAYYNDGTLYSRIKGADGYSLYEDIFVGDYFQMSRPISAYERTGQYQTVGSDYVTIAGISTLKRNGDTDAINYEHLVMVPGKGFGGTQHFGKSRMNETDTTVGGYLGSEMNATTIGAVATSGSTAATATINQQLYAEFGAHLKTTREIVSKAVNNTGYNRFGNAGGCASEWEWGDYQAVLMSEVEVYGSEVWSSSGFDTGNANHQLPLFFFSTEAQNNRSAWYWLKGVASSAYFCSAGSDGLAGYSRAGFAGNCVRPRFVIA